MKNMKYVDRILVNILVINVSALGKKLVTLELKHDSSFILIQVAL